MHVCLRVLRRPELFEEFLQSRAMSAAKSWESERYLFHGLIPAKLARLHDSDVVRATTVTFSKHLHVSTACAPLKRPDKDIATAYSLPLIYTPAASVLIALFASRQSRNTGPRKSPIYLPVSIQCRRLAIGPDGCRNF